MILFICNGNVARSQIAEELYRLKTHKNVQSAGTKVSIEKNGIKLINDGELAINAIRNIKRITGIDISNNIRKAITQNMLENVHGIIIMADRESLPDYINNYYRKIEYWDIKDPKNDNYDGYKIIIEEIERRISKLD